MNITAKQYAQAWYELLQDKKTSKQVNKKMLAHLYAKGKLSKLSDILRSLEEIEHLSRGIEHAVVTTAHEITDTQAKKLAKEILKTDAIISKKIDAELIGGVKIETKNKRWDLSIKSQLLSLSKQIT
jgi:F0F1-type ATP synthase delta subunit